MSDFVGWLKIGSGRWQKVATAATADAALELVQRHADEAGHQHRSITFLPDGLDPNQRPGRPGRHRTRASRGEQ